MTAPLHPAFRRGSAAVVTGAASGIGLAAAHRLAALGLHVWMADRADTLESAAAAVRAASPGVEVTAHVLDVADAASVSTFKDQVEARHGAPAVLMNNAGVSGGGASAIERPEAWRRTLDVNLFGVLNGCQAFAPGMIASGAACAIVNTGSKQGITTPPGDTAYNVSKAGVKVLTEGLAHTLRTAEGAQVSAHLFVPGFVWTGMTARGRPEKPAGAWTPEQTVEHLFARMAEGDFYILCPDNETTPKMDRKRVAWAAGDIVENRPALSRWHADWADRFAAYMAETR